MRAVIQRFTVDHHQVLTLLETAQREMRECAEEHKATGRKPPLAAFTELARRLRAHLRLEEEQLFPAAERLAGETESTVTGALRREHAALCELLADVEQELRRDNCAGAIGNLAELKAALVMHELKERRVLYPILQRGEPQATVKAG